MYYTSFCIGCLPLACHRALDVYESPWISLLDSLLCPLSGSSAVYQNNGLRVGVSLCAAGPDRTLSFLIAGCSPVRDAQKDLSYSFLPSALRISCEDYQVPKALAPIKRKGQKRDATSSFSYSGMKWIERRLRASTLCPAWQKPDL